MGLALVGLATLGMSVVHLLGGDNVGDVAGMGADIFDSYVASTVAAMLLGSALFAGDAAQQAKYTLLPLLLCALGILASLLGTRLVRIGGSGDPGAALNRGTRGTCLVFAAMDRVARKGGMLSHY